MNGTSHRGWLMVVAIVLTRTSLLAHDMWIDPMTFFPESGEVVGVRLRVGQDLIGDPLPRDPALINQFVVQDDKGRKPLVGRDGADPAGFLRITDPGLLVVAYHSKPSAVELAADKFNQILPERRGTRRRRRTESAAQRDWREGAGNVLPLREEPRVIGNGDRGTRRPIARLADRARGRRKSVRLHAGQKLPVRLTFENRPLPGALVVAINRRNPSEKLTARSDRDGRVRFHLRQSGMWLVKAVHMVPAPAGSNAEWASYWASLTFELRPANVEGPVGMCPGGGGIPRVLRRVAAAALVTCFCAVGFAHRDRDYARVRRLRR